MSIQTHIEASEEISLTEHTPPRLQHVRRNFILLFMDMLFFGTAFTLIGSTTVAPDFVRNLTNSDLVIGLVGSIYSVAWLLPQLLFAQMINRATRRLPYLTRTVIPFRLIMVATALIIAIIGPENHTVTLVLFLTGYTLFAAGDGLVTIAWADLLGTAIPDRWRGVMFGIAQFLLAFTVLAMRAVVRQLLGADGPPFPQNYAQIFGLAGVLFVIAGVFLSLLAEEKQEMPVESGPSMREYFPYLGNVLRQDKAFRHFVITRSLLDLTLLAAPFYIIVGKDQLHLPSDALVGDSILLATVGSGLASLMMGWFSHRSGSRVVIQMLGLASIVHPLLAFLSLYFGYPLLYAAFFMLGFVTAATTPGYFDWIITYAPPAHRPIYIGLTNTISAVSHLAPLVGGFILSATSYPILFVAALTMGVAGLVSSLFLIEPRKRAQA
jgi:MFS family permease